MANRITRTVTIGDSATTSGEVFVGDGHLVGIKTDSGYDTGDITFTDSVVSGGTFTPVRDADNNDLSILGAVASATYALPSHGTRCMQWIKIVSATSQTGSTTISLILMNEKRRLV